ncbi:MAG: OsmC family protein [Peptoniphilus sp.]|nr:OsmC family protein [Peptoniphilus sp.]MDY3119028.1 OsmC family protein [Peptoniphilus sp.]
MNKPNREGKSRVAKRVDKPREARTFSMSMRGTCQDLKEVHLYTDRKELVVGCVMSFDNEYDGVTAMSYFLGSLLSSMMHTTIKEMKQSGVVIDEIEGLIHAELKNPLRMVPVRGYDDPPEIESIRVKLFYYADGDEERLNAMVEKAQEVNPIFRLVHRAVPVELKVEWVL